MLCPHCSKPVSTVAAKCVHCGGSTHVAPERSRSVIQCPRCKVDAELVSLGPVDVDSCATCGNVWFDNSELERASAAADGAAGADLRDAVRALGPSHPAPAGPSVVECPFCSEALVRRTHPTVPGVVAQVCLTHGAWLERAHLLRLVDDLETQGLEELRARDARRVAERKALERTAERDRTFLHRVVARRLWFWFPFI